MKRLLAIGPDLVGLLGLGLLCFGIYRLFGEGWTCVAAGALFLALYVWREVRVIYRRV